MPPVIIFYDSELSRFNFGAGHPFTGARFEAFVELLEKTGLKEYCEFIPITPAKEEDLLLTHTGEYLRCVKYLERVSGMLTMDTPVTKDVVDVQTLITGSGLQAAELLMVGENKIAHTFGGFHHAGRDYGEGFCIYNDVAIVTQALIERNSLKRILILDTDAHQGNGTMDVFYTDPRVLFVSIHQDPRTLYPGKGFVREIGSNEGMGYTVNIPVPPYSGNKQYEFVFDEVIMPLAREFNPELIIRNGGSDPYYGDELTMLGLDLDGLNVVGKKVRGVSEDTSNKLLDMMVSGYGNMVIYGWLALLCGVEALDIDYKAAAPVEPPRSTTASEDSLDKFTHTMVEELRQQLKDYWDCI